MENAEELDIWGEPGERPLNASEQQVTFVKALFRLGGGNPRKSGIRTKAAKLAGYAPGSQNASNVFNTRTVQGLILLVQGAQRDDLVDYDEFCRILSEEVRNASGVARGKAAELYLKLRPEFAGTSKSFSSPEEFVQAVEQLSPEAAAILAPTVGADWPMKVESLPKLVPKANVTPITDARTG